MILPSPQLTHAWKPLRYHPKHAALWDTAVSRKKRFIAACAGRGSGKTELARRFITLSLAIQKEEPAIYAYCLPTFPQARKVAWYPILSLIPPRWIAKNGINKTESSITTIFGSTLYIVGMDKPYRIEGLQLDGCIVDESSDQRPGMFAKTIVPMLTHRNAWCWRIGVPKKSGVGRLEYRTFFEEGLDPNHPTQASFHWKSADILTPTQLAEVKSQLDPEEFREQFEAEWLDAGGSVYHNFSKENISDAARYTPGERIYVGCDFNVSPMAWTLSHFKDGKLYVFDEIFLRDSNTPKTLDALHEKYGLIHSAADGEWTFIGDASARARKTNATRTDYLLIKNDVRFGHKKVLFPLRNPHLRDRFACVNAALLNANEERRVLIHPQCKYLRNDLLTVAYKEGTSDIENYDGTDIGHISDALGYTIYRLMPIKIQRTYAPTVHIGN